MTGAHWRPNATPQALAARAWLLAAIRKFFAAREVLEVETPLLCAGTVTDPTVLPWQSAGRWLQTSPEYAMKRLLAAGSGPIYQICKAFRAGEAGARHNPEFTLLEWYRPGFDLNALMDEVAALLRTVLPCEQPEKIRYAELFQAHTGSDPHRATASELSAVARRHLAVSFESAPRNTWLDLLFSHLIEPTLRDRGPVFIYDYPASQAALAQLGDADRVRVARRFELYVDGLELANGYLELRDAAEQQHRFQADQQQLAAQGEPPRPLDERLLAALAAGLPTCSGVALGIDRLLMLQLGVEQIDTTLSFGWQRA